MNGREGERGEGWEKKKCINEEFPWSGTFNCNNKDWLGRRRKQFGKEKQKTKTKEMRT